MSGNSSDEFLLDGVAIKQGDKRVLRNLSQLGDKLKELQLEVQRLEAQLEGAKKEYEHYAHTVIPAEMFSAGVEGIQLSSGGSMTLKHAYYCQPNKNAEDRATIVKWLRANGGGHIVQHDATVASEDFEKLEKTGIPFAENTSVNTARLKSFLKDGIGVSSGVQKFTIDDIPKCIHFQEVVSVELSV